jgi:hypothetical protein
LDVQRILSPEYDGGLSLGDERTTLRTLKLVDGVGIVPGQFGEYLRRDCLLQQGQRFACHALCWRGRGELVNSRRVEAFSVPGDPRLSAGPSRRRSTNRTKPGTAKPRASHRRNSAWPVLTERWRTAGWWRGAGISSCEPARHWKEPSGWRTGLRKRGKARIVGERSTHALSIRSRFPGTTEDSPKDQLT